MQVIFSFSPQTRPAHSWTAKSFLVARAKTNPLLHVHTHNMAHLKFASRSCGHHARARADTATMALTPVWVNPDTCRVIADAVDYSAYSSSLIMAAALHGACSSSGSSGTDALPTKTAVTHMVKTHSDTTRPLLPLCAVCSLNSHNIVQCNPHQPNPNHQCAVTLSDAPTWHGERCLFQRSLSKHSVSQSLPFSCATKQIL